jgi:hypothetical protein
MRLLPLPLLFLALACGRVENTIDLSGTWRYKIDSLDHGIKEQVYLTQFPLDTLHLPGSLATNGKGFEVGVNTEWMGQVVDRSWYSADKYEKYRRPGNIKIPFWLQPELYYAGPAWYQREVRIPQAWKGRRIILNLERCHWTTTVWMDDNRVGEQTSLATPHRYDLTRFAKPGQHLLTIRVDNRMFVDVGVNAHSVSDHTQSNWNGLVGDLSLQALPMVTFGNIRIYPDISKKIIRVVGAIENLSGRPEEVSVTARVTADGSASTIMSPVKFIKEVQTGSEAFEFFYPLGDSCKYWDEFSPNLYNLTLTVKMNESGLEEAQQISFGMRDFKADGTRFSVNGRPTFLRGTLECAIFPKTGYPATDMAEWQRIFRVIKSHGLNHMRFHSWCPPEAAFAAADREGIYLYVECGAWTNVGTGNDFDEWLYAEGDRIVAEYGNHPSFVMMSYGNEPGGSEQVAFLDNFVKYWKQKDPRRVYTSASGWPKVPSADFYSTPDPRIQRWGEGLNSIINAQPPQTRFDFREILASGYPDKPAVSHEIGQWCVYPNLEEISKYTGPLKAKNFEIFRETLEEANLGNLSHKFLIASGKLQALCYKADIEAALRTPGMAGFQLLDLHDFPGQGTALVGVLDPFWEEKGYITPQEYSRFCNPVVPLARMEKLVLKNSETFRADIEIANYGPAAITGSEIRITIQDNQGKVVRESALPAQDYPTGTNTVAGTFEWPLAGVDQPSEFTLEVSVGTHMNHWNFWVYPEIVQPEPMIPVFQKVTPALEKLMNEGGTAILSLGPDRVTPDHGGNIALGFSSIFWNTAWTRGQAPHTLGILCDPGHPALAGFPTDNHIDYQWWEIIHNARPLLFDQPDTLAQPIVRVIDDWFTNRSLALVFETKCGSGRLIITGADLVNGLDQRPAAKQLLASLKKYAVSQQFQPLKNLTIEEVKKY